MYSEQLTASESWFQWRIKKGDTNFDSSTTAFKVVIKDTEETRDTWSVCSEGKKKADLWIMRIDDVLSVTIFSKKSTLSLSSLLLQFAISNLSERRQQHGGSRRNKIHLYSCQQQQNTGLFMQAILHDLFHVNISNIV